MSMRHTRDELLRLNPERADVILDRDAAVKKWCAEHGRDPEALTMAEALEIRATREWQEAGR